MTDNDDQANIRVSRFGFWMGVASFVVIVDQLTKWGVTKWLRLVYDDGIILYREEVILPILKIVYQENRGAAFSFLANQSGWQRWFFIVLATGISVAITIWLHRIRARGPLILQAGLALVLGGAVGNLVDRVRTGAVVDFIQVRIAGVPFLDPFPSFNVADMAITAGAALLIIDSIWFSGRQSAD